MTIEEWADDQLTLESRHVAGHGGAERRRVKLRWWSVPNRHRRPGVGRVTVLWSMARGNAFDDRDVHVALYQPDAAPGAPPLVTFVAREGTGLVEASGRALGTAVGRVEAGAALLIETSRGTVLPGSMPAAPGDEAPGWSETDREGPAAPVPVPQAEPGAGAGAGRVSRWRRRPRPPRPG